MPQCNEVYIHVALELESLFLTQTQQFDKDTLKVYVQRTSKASWADGNGSLSEFFFSHAINKQSFKVEITMLFLFSRSDVSNMNHPLSSTDSWSLTSQWALLGFAAGLLEMFLAKK